MDPIRRYSTYFLKAQEPMYGSALLAGLRHAGCVIHGTIII